MDVALEGKGIAQLDFSSHDDSTASPSERVAVESIQRLNASRNHISSIRRLTIFRQLVVLDLSYNKLTSPVGLWIPELPPSIRELHLAHNEISSLQSSARDRDSGSIYDTFCRPFPHLEVLDLSGNLLSEPYNDDSDDDGTEAPLDAVASRLAVVNLGDNLSLSSINKILGGCRSLRDVTLDGNRIASLEGILCLAACGALERVSLRGCDVESKLQDPSFLEATFAVERHESRGSGIGQLFFASFVSQVLPHVSIVNDVAVAAANEIVLPILAVAREVQQRDAEHHRPPASSKMAMPPRATVKVAQPDRVEAMSSILANRTAEAHQRLFADTSSLSSQDRPNSSSTSVTQPPAHSAHNDKEGSEETEDDEGEDIHRNGANTSSYQAVMNSIISKGTLGGRNVSKTDERRILSLENRCHELQNFLMMSSQSCRRLAAANDEVSATLHDKRQLVALQLKELAALRLEMEKGEVDVDHLQHIILKRTRELDHAEQSNIRMVEKQLSSLVEEKKKSEEARRRQVVRGASGVSTVTAIGTSPTRSSEAGRAMKLTTGNLLVMEATQRKLEELRARSPTAAVGSKFRYDEFGNPGADNLSAPNLRASLPEPVKPLSPKVSHIDPNVSEVQRTMHVPSPSRVFAAPPPFAFGSTAPPMPQLHPLTSASTSPTWMRPSKILQELPGGCHDRMRTRVLSPSLGSNNQPRSVQRTFAAPRRPHQTSCRSSFLLRRQACLTGAWFLAVAPTRLMHFLVTAIAARQCTAAASRMSRRIRPTQLPQLQKGFRHQKK